MIICAHEYFPINKLQINYPMKMNNDDLKKITEVKQYLLDPPASFKLYEYALVYLKDAVDILASYPKAKDTIAYLENISEQIKDKTILQNELRSILKKAGIKISQLTNR